MAEATLVHAKLSAGQPIEKPGINGAMGRSVMPKLALAHKANCGSQLLERSGLVGARHVSHEEPNNYKWGSCVSGCIPVHLSRPWTDTLGMNS